MATVTAPQPQIIPPPVRGLIIPETPDGFTFRVGRSPATMIAEAELCATALMAAVKRNGWVKNLGGRDHLYFEAWSFLAMMYRVTARVKETRLVRIDNITGYEAFAEAFYIPSQIVISTADSMCLDDEDNWDTRPEYEWQGKTRKKVGEKQVPLFQLRSMAQTRSMSRALRGPFSWIIAMAGYAPTTAEDMGTANAAATAATEGNQPQPQQQTQQQQMPREKTPANSGAVISDKQASRLWGIAYSLYPNNRKAAGEAVNAALRQYGFEQPDQVTLERYDDVIKAIQQPKGGTTQ